MPVVFKTAKPMAFFFFFLKSLYITAPYNSTKYKVALLKSLRGAEAQRLMGEGKELHKVTGDG